MKVKKRHPDPCWASGVPCTESANQASTPNRAPPPGPQGSRGHEDDGVLFPCNLHPIQFGLQLLMPCPVVRLSSPVMDRTPRHIADRHDGPGARTHDMFMHFPESREFGPGPGSGRQGAEPGHQDNVVEVSLPDQLQDPRVLDLSGKKGRDPFPSPRRSQIPVASESFISDPRPGAVTVKGRHAPAVGMEGAVGQEQDPLSRFPGIRPGRLL